MELNFNSINVEMKYIRKMKQISSISRQIHALTVYVYMFHWSGMCHVTHFKDGFSIFKWPSYRNCILFVLILSISLWCLLPMMCADHKIRLPKEMIAKWTQKMASATMYVDNVLKQQQKKSLIIFHHINGKEQKIAHSTKLHSLLLW